MSYFDGYFGPSGGSGGTSNSSGKQQLESELKISLSDYPDTYIDNLFLSAGNILKLKTNRSTFSGCAESAAEQAILYMVIDRLANSNRDLIKGAIKEIDENGAKIVFNNGKDLSSYKTELTELVRSLTLKRSSYPGRITFTGDISFFSRDGH